MGLTACFMEDPMTPEDAENQPGDLEEGTSKPESPTMEGGDDANGVSNSSGIECPDAEKEVSDVTQESPIRPSPPSVTPAEPSSEPETAQTTEEIDLDID